MEISMVGLQAAKYGERWGKTFARLVLGAALAAVFAPVGAAFAQADSAPSIHTPAIRANKIILPQTAGAQLITNHATYPVGQPVQLQFRVTNPTKKPMRYDFASAQQADFTVADSSGNTLWDSTQNTVSFHGITHLVLAPGQSHVYTATWNQRDLKARPVPAGAYTISAHLIPMPSVVVSGGLIVNTDRDPANLGMPMKGKSETGETIQQNTTPSVSASTRIKIASHG